MGLINFFQWKNNMHRSDIKVFDCTVRDGGLMNKWQFSDRFVEHVYNALSASSIDYMEIGYLSSERSFDSKVYGPWRFCFEKDLKRIVGNKKKKIKLSAMADIGRIDYDDIPIKAESSLDMIRVACYVHQVDEAIDLAEHIIDKGYETTINLMAVSSVEVKDLNMALKRLAKCKVPIIYLVDSFGSFYQKDINKLVVKYLKYLPNKTIGIHCHNNQQLAFANTTAAMLKGVCFLDATLNGIGRGAGNCPLELLLPFINDPKYNVRPILECIESDIYAWAKKIEWGYSVPYMMTGVLNQHPRDAIAHMDSSEKEKITNFYDTLMHKDHIGQSNPQQ
jgi:4-hydroxy 2-oxovalerate aldolase